MAYAYRVKIGEEGGTLVDITSFIDLESFNLTSDFDSRLPKCEFGIIDDWKAESRTAALAIRLWSFVKVERSVIGDFSDADVRFIGLVTGLDRAQVGTQNLMAVTASGYKVWLTTQVLTGTTYQWGSVAPGSYFHTTDESTVTYTLIDGSATSKIKSMFVALDASYVMDSQNATVTTNKLFDLRGKNVAEAMDEVCDQNDLNWTINWDGSGNKVVLVRKNIGGNQIITNPEFENSTVTWTLSSASIAGGYGRSGDASDKGLKITAASGSGSATVSVNGGKTYAVFGNIGVKNNGATVLTGTIKLQWKLGATILQTDTSSYSGTSSSLTWTNKEMFITAPATATTCTVSLSAGATGMGTGSVQFDNIYMLQQTAPWRVSWSPDGTTSFAPQDWTEPMQADAPINAVYIYGGKSVARKWFYNYASYAYFNRWFEAYESDDKINTLNQAEGRAQKIFAEHAFPRIEGTYATQQHGMAPGQQQIIENLITGNSAIYTIASVEEKPTGTGQVEYRIAYGAHPRDRFAQLINSLSGVTPTSAPKTTSPANAKAGTAASIQAQMVKSTPWSEIVANQTLTDFPTARGVAPENRSPLVVQRTPGQSDATALSVVTLPVAELPSGAMTLVVPETGVTTQPQLYRVDSAGSTWEAVTPANLKATAIANGALSQGMVVADSIVAGTIDASIIDVVDLNATNITTGTLTSIAIQSGTSPNYKFTVDALGNATANALTIGATTSDTVGSDTTGRIAIVPSATQSAASFQVQTDTAANLYASANLLSTTAGSSSSDSTVTTEAAHGFVAGQFVSFHDTGNATWNAITAAVPVQIKATPTTTTFTIRPHVALSALASNNAGTARAYKRLNIVAPGGAFVYQSGSVPGVLGSGSLVLGASLTTLGQGSLATISDGEMAFLTALDSSTVPKTPRYGSGGNLYSRTGSTDVSTSGDFILGTSDTSTQGDVRFKTGTGGRIGAFSATSGNTSIAAYNSSRSAYAAFVALGFYPNQGTANLSHNGSTFTMNDSVAVTGGITATTTIVATGNLTAANLPTYVRADISSSSTTSIPAGSFQSHSLSWTTTGASTPYVVASAFMTTASTVSMTAVVFGQSATTATIYLYNTSSSATTVGRRAQGIGVAP